MHLFFLCLSSSLQVKYHLVAILVANLMNYLVSFVSFFNVWTLYIIDLIIWYIYSVNVLYFYYNFSRITLSLDMTVVIRDLWFYFIDKKLAAYNGIFCFQLNAPTFILQEILTNIKSDIKKNLLCTCICLCKLSAGILYRCACAIVL